MFALLMLNRRLTFEIWMQTSLSLKVLLTIYCVVLYIPYVLFKSSLYVGVTRNEKRFLKTRVQGHKPLCADLGGLLNLGETISMKNETHN